jgi:uncharacterized membrane protein (DUF485 family)
MFTNFLKHLVLIGLMFAAFVSFNLGMDWINFGHGLHPAIAFPIATLAIVMMFILPAIYSKHEDLADQPIVDFNAFADAAEAHRKAKIAELSNR